MERTATSKQTYPKAQRNKRNLGITCLVFSESSLWSQTVTAKQIIFRWNFSKNLRYFGLIFLSSTYFKFCASIPTIDLLQK